MFSMDFATGLGGPEWIIGLAIFSLIAFPGLFIIMLKSNKIALYLIFTLAFTRVLFHFAGLPRMVPSILTEVCVLSFLVKAFYTRFYIQRRPLRVTGLYPMSGILLISAISFLVNRSEVLPAIFFLRQVFIFYLFFLALMNLDLKEQTIRTMNRYVILLFLIQLPAGILKYALIGQQELWAGTVSWQAGQFGTTLPLFAIAFLIAYYFTKGSFTTFFFLYLGYVFFGIIGQKRALPVFIPTVLLLAWFLNWRDKATGFIGGFSMNQLKSLVLVLFFAFAALTSYAFVSKDEMFLHGLNPKKLIEYIYWYNTRDDIAAHSVVKKEVFNAVKKTDSIVVLDKMDNADYGMGRVKITKLVLHSLRNEGAVRLLLGFGPGFMISSPHLGRSNIAYEKFGVRGAMTGFIVFVLQLGFIGVMFFIWFFIVLFRKAFIVFKATGNHDLKMVALAFMGITYVFLLDFFVYSQSTFFFGVLTPVYFYMASIVMRKDYNGYKLFAPLNKTVPFNITNGQEKVER